MGAKGQLSHRDPPFLPWGRKEESRGAIVEGKRPGKPMSMSTLGQPNPRKNSSSTMGRTLLGHGCSRGKREQPATGSDTPGHFTEQEKY